jgi:hypothetical protein
MAEVNGTTFVVFKMFARPSSGNLAVAFYEAEIIEHDDATIIALKPCETWTHPTNKTFTPQPLSACLLQTTKKSWAG